jgi:hypothetical protein
MSKYCKVSNYNIKKSLKRKSYNRSSSKKTSKKGENSGLCVGGKSTKRRILPNKPRNIVRSIKGGNPSVCQGIKPKNACLTKGCVWVNRGKGYCRSKAHTVNGSASIKLNSNDQLKKSVPLLDLSNRPVTRYSSSVVPMSKTLFGNRSNDAYPPLPPTPTMSPYPPLPPTPTMSPYPPLPPTPTMSPYPPLPPTPTMSPYPLNPSATSEKKFPIIFKYPLAMFDDIRGDVLSSDEPNAANLDEEARDSLYDAILYFQDKEGGIAEQMKDINLILNKRFDVKYLDNNDSVLVYSFVDKDWSSQREEIEDILGNIGDDVNSFDGYEIEYQGVNREDLSIIPSNNKFYKLTNVLLGDHDPVLDRFKLDSP